MFGKLERNNFSLDWKCDFWYTFRVFTSCSIGVLTFGHDSNAVTRSRPQKERGIEVVGRDARKGG